MKTKGHMLLSVVARKNRHVPTKRMGSSKDTNVETEAAAEATARPARGWGSTSNRNTAHDVPQGNAKVGRVSELCPTRHERTPPSQSRTNAGGGREHFLTPPVRPALPGSEASQKFHGPAAGPLGTQLQSSSTKNE